MMIYSNPEREQDPHALPDVEVFYVSEQQAAENSMQMDNCEENWCPCCEPGWFWKSAFPGCLRDGDLMGQLETKEDAIEKVKEIRDARISQAYGRGTMAVHRRIFHPGKWYREY